MQETWVQSLGWEDPLEKRKATHSSIWTEKPGGLQSMGSQIVGHDWVTNTFTMRIALILTVIIYPSSHLLIHPSIHSFIHLCTHPSTCVQACFILSMDWNSPGQNTGVGSLSFLQGIFPTQGLNSGLPHFRQILYQLSHKGSPRILEWVAYPFSSGSSQPRNWTGVSCIAGGFFTNWAMREALLVDYILK